MEVPGFPTVPIARANTFKSISPHYTPATPNKWYSMAEGIVQSDGQLDAILGTVGVAYDTSFRLRRASSNYEIAETRISGRWTRLIL